MKQITTVKSQTVFDLAVQEYGNMEAVFEIINNNPELIGMNDYPDGHSVDETIDFDMSFPIKPGVKILIDETSALYNTVIIKQLSKVIS